MIIAGNPNFGLCAELIKLYPTSVCVSRSSDPSMDLTVSTDQAKFASLASQHDTIILCSALWKFNQTILLDVVYKKCVESNTTPHIICIGSTTDRVKKGGAWLYNAEKKALRDYCNTLGITGVWDNGPRVSLISFGSLSNVQSKHPTRTCLDITIAATYIKWLVDQPKYLHINEISIDPVQK